MKSNTVVGVITPDNRFFEHWKSEIGFDKYGTHTIFIKINRIKDVVGRYFDNLEYAYNYLFVEKGVIEAAKKRLR